LTPAAERIACADSSFPRLSHAAALAVIGDLGIKAVDVCVFAGYEHTTPAAVVADPTAAADAVAGRLAANDLTASDVFAILADDFETLAVNHPDRAVRGESSARFAKVLEFAARLGAPGLTILPGALFPGVARESGIELAATELQRRAEAAAEAGLRLSVEPHYRSIAETPAAALELVELAPDLSLALDYSHFIFQGIRQADVDPLIERAAHVHLRQAAPGVMQARTREGTIDFAAVLDALEAAEYQGFLAIEYQCEEWLECRRVDCITETAEMRDLVLDWAGQPASSNGDKRPV
jgi:sugar phosphate isomerase/epimerase